MRKWIVEGYFQCSICNFKSNSLSKFKYHECDKRCALQEKWTVDGRFQCIKCDIKITEFDTFCIHQCTRKHLMIDAQVDDGPHAKRAKTDDVQEFPKAVIKCETCDQEFSSTASLKRHIDQVHKKLHVRRFKCDHCGKYFSQNIYMKRHRATCQSKPIANSLPVISNIKTEIVEQSEIELENKGPESTNSQTNTEKNCEKITKISFKCDECPNEFLHKSSLKRHFETQHMKLKPFKCDKCGNTFTRKENLDSHNSACQSKSQENSLPMILDVYSEPNESTLPIISSIKTEVLDISDHDVSTDLVISNVSGGQESDVTPKPRDDKENIQYKSIGNGRYKCEICEKTVACKQIAIDHINSIHRNLKCHECQLCQSKFGYYTTLRKHVKKVHKQ